MKKISIYLIMFIALLVNIYYGAQKSGFHEDEYYTYFSTNRSLGLYQPDREWQDKQTILDEFAVKEGEGFNYWKQLLDSGAKSRDDLVREFAYSQEFSGIMASYGL